MDWEQLIEARHELQCCENVYQIALDYAECHRRAPALAPLVLFVYCDKRNIIVVAEISALPYIPRPDVAGGAYTKEAEEADRKAEDHFVDREADEHFVDRQAARGQEDHDRAAAEKSSDPGSDALFHRATLGDNL
ncbi:hypothetical protein KIN20_009811 [Parelaphostrongylus tenuis]|uniref:Uncharacterized protein n=1 Tax=Parelaphostrongylus tenuis TaxID=148309 RepID=A0AAD5QJW7_PARTN|nr:hypothetical protein KIN20_009811 [Parelaphostrongylus tenuis]